METVNECEVKLWKAAELPVKLTKVDSSMTSLYAKELSETLYVRTTRTWCVGEMDSLTLELRYINRATVKLRTVLRNSSIPQL